MKNRHLDQEDNNLYQLVSEDKVYKIIAIKLMQDLETRSNKVVTNDIFCFVLLFITTKQMYNRRTNNKNKSFSGSEFEYKQNKNTKNIDDEESIF